MKKYSSSHAGVVKAGLDLWQVINPTLPKVGGFILEVKIH